jgi:hypothetical protein
LGEVHEVPYDPAVLALPDAARRRAVLDWLQWQDGQVTWAPWTDDVAPPDHKWWINDVARLSVPDA